MTAAIYQLSRGFEVWVWLCTDHLAKRKRKGWEVKERREPPHPLTCDDCKRKAKA